jgi:hypothetical protein
MMIEAFREESRPARSSRSGAVATEAEIKGQRMKMKKGIAECVGKILKRYRQKDCTVGRISSDSDYKHLCRKVSQPPTLDRSLPTTPTHMYSEYVLRRVLAKKRYDTPSCRRPGHGRSQDCVPHHCHYIGVH